MQLATSLHPEVSHLHEVGSNVPEVEVVLLCADVVEFARMTERLGDRRSLAVMQRVARMVRARIAEHRGRELEIRGDLFLVAFSSPLQAVACAISIQRGLGYDAVGHPDESVRVRISLHAGTALREGNGYFGRNVILPFRLLSETRGGEISATSDLMNRLAGDWQWLATPEQAFRPQGFRGEVSFHLLDWSTDVRSRTSPPADWRLRAT